VSERTPRQHNATRGQRGEGNRQQDQQQPNHSTSRRTGADRDRFISEENARLTVAAQAAMKRTEARERLRAGEPLAEVKRDLFNTLHALRATEKEIAATQAWWDWNAPSFEHRGGATAPDDAPGMNGERPDRSTRDSSSDDGDADDAPVDDDGMLGQWLSDVIEEEIHWLWHGRVALGKITMCDGEPDKGKSVVTIDLAKRVRMNESMPDGSPGLGKRAGVVIVCGEDGLADTVLPRMKTAGADAAALRRVRVIDLVPEKLESGEISKRLLSLVADLPKLEDVIKRAHAKLLIIDPITAYLGAQVDINKDSHVRQVLTPLALMAERLGVAILLVRHLNKDEAKSAMNRGMGSVAFVGVARMALLFVENPYKEGERLLGRYKGNIGAPPPTWAYRITQVDENESHIKVEWLGERSIKVTDALAQQGAKPGVVDTVMAFLRDELRDGELTAKEVFKRGEEAGHSRASINRAKEKLGIDPRRVVQEKRGEDGAVVKVPHWRWGLPKGQDD
jgi:hypothetical protein